MRRSQLLVCYFSRVISLRFVFENNCLFKLIFPCDWLLVLKFIFLRKYLMKRTDNAWDLISVKLYPNEGYIFLGFRSREIGNHGFSKNLLQFKFWKTVNRKSIFLRTKKSLFRTCHVCLNILCYTRSRMGHLVKIMPEKNLKKLFWRFCLVF